MTAVHRRGSYAKGVAKREEILERALDVIAREGFRGASVRELAEAVGLSQAGLLHYFDSKEELFTAILRKRDEVDFNRFGPVDPGTGDTPLLRERYVEVVRRTADVPGLVELFARLAVDAADPAHPAHPYFVERGDAVRAALTTTIVRLQQDGELTDAIDAPVLARVLQAVVDGLQVQWMLDPGVDMAGTLDALFEVLATRPGDAS